MLKNYRLDGYIMRSLMSYLSYSTRRRLREFSTDMWRPSVGKKYLSWRCSGHGLELRWPPECWRMRCGNASLDSSLWKTEVQCIISTPCFFLVVCVIVWVLCVCVVVVFCSEYTPLGKFWDRNFLSEGGYKTRVSCPRVFESVRSWPGFGQLGLALLAIVRVWYSICLPNRSLFQYLVYLFVCYVPGLLMFCSIKSGVDRC